MSSKFVPQMCFLMSPYPAATKGSFSDVSYPAPLHGGAEKNLKCPPFFAKLR